MSKPSTETLNSKPYTLNSTEVCAGKYWQAGVKSLDESVAKAGENRKAEHIEHLGDTRFRTDFCPLDFEVSLIRTCRESNLFRLIIYASGAGYGPRSPSHLNREPYGTKALKPKLPESCHCGFGLHP